MKDATLETSELTPSAETPATRVGQPVRVDSNSIYETACYLSSGSVVDFGGTTMTPLDDW